MKRNKFSLSHRRIFTADMGKIVPIGLQRVLPGDSFRHSSSMLLRISPLLAPVMHPVRIKISHYFVPDRLVWDDAEAFYTGGDDGLQAPVPPYVTFTGANQIAEGDLGDYLGLPTDVDLDNTAGKRISAIPFRGMALIYNEHKRNTQLQTPLVVSKASGADTTTVKALQNSNWQKDYFTSCTPDPQLGPEVTIPIGTEAPVILDPTATTPVIALRDSNHATIPGPTDVYTRMTTGALTPFGEAYDIALDPNGTLIADLSAVTGITIRQLRESAALQKFFEAQNMHGSRYSELLSQWGVRYSDARLQRPELLGSSSHVVQVSEVLQTGVTTDGDPDLGVGNLRGHGIASAKGNTYIKSFEEHGYVFSLMEVLPETMYVQGVGKEWIKSDKTQHFIPQFAHIGDQEVLNFELKADHATPLGVFGYNRRYEEYRRAVSTVHGQFRSTLDFWHYARLFAGDPALNSSFVTADPTKRVNQVTSEHVLWCFVNHSIQARRIVSKDGEPGGGL